MEQPYLFAVNDTEPFFTIRGRDPAAVVAIEAWIAERQRLIRTGLLPNTKEEHDHIASATNQLQKLRDWQPKSFGTQT